MLSITRSGIGAVMAAAGLALAVPAVGHAATVTFGPGTATWTVPDGVTTVSVTAVGGSGGRDGASGSACTPGYGAKMNAISLPVTPGETIDLRVGAAGGDGSHATGGSGGQPDGGAGGSVAPGKYSAGGGGGGGSTYVADGSLIWYARAAGGGGCGGFAGAAGGNGGSGGTNASASAGSAGSGGPDGAAGGGGPGVNPDGGQNVPVDGTHGAPGRPNQGGAGYGSTAFLAGGGGGGGGVTGGGGGGAAGSNDGSGGGGGGGLDGSRAFGAAGTAAALGDGSVTIIYATDPPSLTLSPASAVTDSSATVGATIDGHGSAPTYYVEYGPTPGYGLRTATAPAGDGGQQTVSRALTGLTPGTVYHYRIVAVNDNGTTASDDGTFQTGAAPTALTGGPTAVTDTLAVVTGTIDPFGEPTQYEVQYGPTSGYGMHTVPVSAGGGSDALPVSVALSGLTPATVYHYRVVAEQASVTVDGDDATFTTTGTPAAAAPGDAGPGSPPAAAPGDAGPGSPPAAAPGDAGPGSPPATPPSPRGSSSAVAKLTLVGKPKVAGTRVRYALACAVARCQVTVRLTGPHGVRLGSQRVSIAAGRRASRVIGLNGLGRRLRRRHRRLATTLRIALAGTSARPQTVRLTFRR